MVTVTISAPAAPTATAAQTVCNSGTVANLTATGVAGSTIAWYSAATGGTALAGTTALTNGGVYYASQTVTGCESATRTQVTVTVNAPAAPTATAAQTVCNSGTVANLTATGVAGSTISWYSAATGGTALAGTTALTNGGVYYASQTVTGCESATRTMVTVTISTVTAPTFTTVQPTCAVATGTITVTAPVGAGFTYSKDGTTFQAGLTFADLAPGSYTITAKNASNCTASATVVINAAPATPAAPTVTTTQPTCAVATGTITVVSPLGAGYTYSKDGTTFQTLAVFTDLTPGTYTITSKLGDCTATATVIINDAPEAPATPTFDVIQPTCAEPTGTIEIISPIADAMTYSLDGITYQASSIFEGLAPGTYTPTVKNGAGCTSSAAPVVINAAPAGPDAPTGDTTQEITVANAADATIEDIMVTAVGTVTWYATEEDALDGTDALPANTQLVDGNTYYGTQTVGECESAPIAVTIDVVLGKDGFDHAMFKYHPNPVKDVLNISYTSEITSVTVFDLLGQQVISKQPNATEVKLDLSALADATYIVNVTSGDTVKTIKVVKKQ